MRSPIGKKYILNPFALTDEDSESRHQIGVMEWCKVASQYGLELANNTLSYDIDSYCENNRYLKKSDKFDCLKWIYAVPNGDERKPQVRLRLNHEGVKSGVEDLALDVPVGQYHGLRIEMKAKNGKQSEKQKEWQKFHNDNGYKSVVCHSFNEAVYEIVYYIMGA